MLSKVLFLWCRMLPKVLFPLVHGGVPLVHAVQGGACRCACVRCVFRAPAWREAVWLNRFCQTRAPSHEVMLGIQLAASECCVTYLSCTAHVTGRIGCSSALWAREVSGRSCVFM